MQNHANKSIKKIAPVAAVAFVATMLVGAFSFTTTAYAAVQFDEDTGIGFVGKGDVQTVFGWNNAALQRNAGGVSFEFESVTVEEVSWECSRPHPSREGEEIVQERARTTTTSIQGIVDSIARERNQITGFNLEGYEGGTPETDVETDGPAVNSCPANPSEFTLKTEAGEPEVISSTGGLFVVFNGNREEL